jgi:uncharacterized protein (TIGR04255 family)
VDYPFPSYKHAPLNEVSIGLQFQPLERLKIPHFGLFWERIREQFPLVEHAPPIVGKSQESSEWFPLPRVWFIDKSDSQLLQLQADRINFNWRFREGADPYPRFEVIATQYFGLLEALEKFLGEADIGVILPTAVELTYVNLFDRGKEWNSTEDFPTLFKDMLWEGGRPRFLPYPSKMSWAISFELPNQQGTLSARLKPGVRIADDQEIMQLEMVASYPIIKDVSLESLKSWYEMAHEWIVKGFDDLTRPEAQEKFWGREK